MKKKNEKKGGQLTKQKEPFFGVSTTPYLFWVWRVLQEAFLISYSVPRLAFFDYLVTT